MLCRARRCLATAASGAAATATARPAAPLALAYDLETTGLVDAEIVQFAACVVHTDAALAPSAEFESVCMPTVAIDSRAAEVHGFTREVLEQRNAPAFSTLFPELQRWVSDRLLEHRSETVVWAAHNGARFDHAIFRREVEAVDGATWPLAWHYADTLPLARKQLPRGGRVVDHKLGTLYHLCTGNDLTDAHDALGDARAVAKIWPWLVTKGSNDALLFNAHLDAATAPAAPSKRVAARAASGAVLRSDTVAAPPTLPSASDAVTAIPGVAARSAAQLKGAGVETCGELVAAWRACGANKFEFKRWLPSGMHRMVKAKLGAWIALHGSSVGADGEAGGGRRGRFGGGTSKL